jgi:two-component system alkaline phosphatase synthesis response regulator PhoP
VRRDELLEQVWGYNSEMTTRTLDVHIGRLRQKIERKPREPETIVTVPGVGYKLQAT